MLIRGCGVWLAAMASFCSVSGVLHGQEGDTRGRELYRVEGATQVPLPWDEVWQDDFVEGAVEDDKASTNQSGTDRIDVSGWIEGSYTLSNVGTETLPMGFNYEPNEFLLQQNWLSFDKRIDKDAASASWGYHLDTIVPGTDYRFTVARGLWDQQLIQNNGHPKHYGVDPVQFYGEYYDPRFGKGTSIKLGRFFSPYGNESIAANQTPLASRSYGFIYNPFTHFGVLVTHQVSERVSLWHGYTTGCDVILDPAASFCYIGGVRFASEDDQDSIQFVTLLGKGKYDLEEAFHNPQVFDLLVRKELHSSLAYALEILYGYTNGLPNAGFADWYSVSQYLTWKWSERVSETTRLEFFEDAEGTRTGSEGLYTAITIGGNWQATNGWRLRPEWRYDHQSQGPFAGQRDLFTGGLSALIAW